jgi:K+-transporting ATPase KdpF subunit
MDKDYLKASSILIVVPERATASLSQSQVLDSIGLIVAILVMGYVIYSLLKPEKF